MKLYESYRIIIEKKAQKFLEALNDKERIKIVLKISELTSKDSESLNIKKLQGYKNLHRLRIDDYRVVFVVLSAKKILAIPVIGLRKDVYDIVKRMAL